jgi:GH24 family phage-related lysozyme (muramidase)
VKLTGKQKIAAGGAVVALAVPLVIHFEGKRNDPYFDVVEKLTVCYGETLNVQQRRYSDEECSAMLLRRLGQFNDELERCITRPVPDNVRAVLMDHYMQHKNALQMLMMEATMQQGQQAALAATVTPPTPAQ